jgi:hypothetical protein
MCTIEVFRSDTFVQQATPWGKYDDSVNSNFVFSNHMCVYIKCFHLHLFVCLICSVSVLLYVLLCGDKKHYCNTHTNYHTTSVCKLAITDVAMCDHR